MSDKEITIGALTFEICTPFASGRNVLVLIRSAPSPPLRLGSPVGQVTMSVEEWQSLERANEQPKEIARCSACPFCAGATVPLDPPLCDAGHDFGNGNAWDDYPREIPRKHLHDEPPPEWCRLRQGPIVIRLAVVK